MSFLSGNNMAWWLQQIPCWCKRFGSDGSEFDVLCIWNNNNCPRRCRNFGHIPTFVIKRGKIIISSFIALSIVHFTVVCLVAKPLNRSKAKGDLVMIQTLLLFKCKLLCYHANWILVSITTRSPSASLQIKGLATKYTTVKWPIEDTNLLQIYLSWHKGSKKPPLKVC